jgi:mannosyltransferase
MRDEITKPSLYLIALVVAAAAVRFSTLGVQSYWEDEGATVSLVQLDLWNMLETIPKTESTPPLYYLLAWGWSNLFGTGEAALRSLSAFLGTAIVPVAYAAAKKLVSSRTGLVTAALVAFNPFLVWYSQEARSYALISLLGALSFLFFVRFVREKRPSLLWWWAAASALALTSHYFAVFLVAPEAVWLIYAAVGKRTAALGAVAVVGATGLALLPLARHQELKPELKAQRAQLIRGETPNYSGGIGDAPLARRVGRIPKEFLVGFEIPGEIELTVVAGLLVLAAIWLLARRASAPERRATTPAAIIGMLMIGLPIVLALAGQDYILPYYLIAALLPWAIVVATGFAATRLGWVLGATLCLLSLALVAAVNAIPRYQRANWRGASQALGPPRLVRAVVVTPSDITGFLTDSPLQIYRPRIGRIPAVGAAVREVDILAVAREGIAPPRQLPRGPGSDFRLTKRVDDETFTLLRFVSRTPVQVTRTTLLPSHLGDWPPHRVTVFIEGV